MNNSLNAVAHRRLDNCMGAALIHGKIPCPVDGADHAGDMNNHIHIPQQSI